MDKGKYLEHMNNLIQKGVSKIVFPEVDEDKALSLKQFLEGKGHYVSIEVKTAKRVPLGRGEEEYFQDSYSLIVSRGGLEDE